MAAVLQGNVVVTNGAPNGCKQDTVNNEEEIQYLELIR